MEKYFKEQNDTANLRLISYNFLSKAFSYPDDETYYAITNSPLKYLKEKDERFGFFDDIPPKEKMQIAYTSYFDVIYKKNGCHLREGEYMEEKSGISNLLLELKGFYKNFGLNLPPNELPDSIAIEFEFMYYLTHLHLKCIEAEEEEKICRILDAQSDFLNRHLHNFIKNVKDKLSRFSELKFYAQISDFAQEFIETDMQILKDAKFCKI